MMSIDDREGDRPARIAAERTASAASAGRTPTIGTAPLADFTAPGGAA